MFERFPVRVTSKAPAIIIETSRFISVSTRSGGLVHRVGYDASLYVVRSSSFILPLTVLCRDVHKEISHRFVTEEARNQSHSSPSNICGGPSSIGSLLSASLP